MTSSEGSFLKKKERVASGIKYALLTTYLPEGFQGCESQLSHLKNSAEEGRSTKE